MMIFRSMRIVTFNQTDVGRVGGSFLGQRGRKPNTKEQKTNPEKKNNKNIFKYTVKNNSIINISCFIYHINTNLTYNPPTKKGVASLRVTSSTT